MKEWFDNLRNFEVEMKASTLVLILGATFLVAAVLF